MLDKVIDSPFSYTINSRMFMCKPPSCGVQKPSVSIQLRCHPNPDVLHLRTAKSEALWSWMGHIWTLSGELATTVYLLLPQLWYVWIGKMKICVETNFKSCAIRLGGDWSYWLVTSCLWLTVNLVFSANPWVARLSPLKMVWGIG